MPSKMKKENQEDPTIPVTSKSPKGRSRKKANEETSSKSRRGRSPKKTKKKKRSKKSKDDSYLPPPLPPPGSTPPSSPRHDKRKRALSVDNFPTSFFSTNTKLLPPGETPPSSPEGNGNKRRSRSPFKRSNGDFSRKPLFPFASGGSEAFMTLDNADDHSDNESTIFQFPASTPDTFVPVKGSADVWLTEGTPLSPPSPPSAPVDKSPAPEIDSSRKSIMPTKTIRQKSHSMSPTAQPKTHPTSALDDKQIKTRRKSTTSIDEKRRSVTRKKSKTPTRASKTLNKESVEDTNIKKKKISSDDTNSQDGQVQDKMDSQISESGSSDTDAKKMMRASDDDKGTTDQTQDDITAAKLSEQTPTPPSPSDNTAKKMNNASDVPSSKKSHPEDDSRSNKTREQVLDASPSNGDDKKPKRRKSSKSKELTNMANGLSKDGTTDKSNSNKAKSLDEKKSKKRRSSKKGKDEAKKIADELVATSTPTDTKNSKTGSKDSKKKSPKKSPKKKGKSPQKESGDRNGEKVLVSEEEPIQKSIDAPPFSAEHKANKQDSLAVNASSEKPIASNKQFLVLVSELSSFREVTANQQMSFSILNGMSLKYKVLDGAAPQNKKRRDELFDLSGVRAEYPQFFVVEGDDVNNIQATSYAGDWDWFKGMNENNNLQSFLA